MAASRLSRLFQNSPDFHDFHDYLGFSGENRPDPGRPGVDCPGFDPKRDKLGENGDFRGLEMGKNGNSPGSGGVAWGNIALGNILSLW